MEQVCNRLKEALMQCAFNQFPIKSFLAIHFFGEILLPCEFVQCSVFIDFSPYIFVVWTAKDFKQFITIRIIGLYLLERFGNFGVMPLGKNNCIISKKIID